MAMNPTLGLIRTPTNQLRTSRKTAATPGLLVLCCVAVIFSAQFMRATEAQSSKTKNTVKTYSVEPKRTSRRKTGKPSARLNTKTADKSAPAAENQVVTAPYIDFTKNKPLMARGESVAEEQIVTTSYCNLIINKNYFDGKLVRVKATVLSLPHRRLLYDSSCTGVMVEPMYDPDDGNERKLEATIADSSDSEGDMGRVEAVLVGEFIAKVYTPKGERAILAIKTIEDVKKIPTYLPWPTELLDRQEAKEEVISVSFCELINDPQKYDGKMIRVNASEHSGPHDSALSDPQCGSTVISTGFDCDDKEDCIRLGHLSAKKAKVVDGERVVEAVFTGRFVNGKPDQLHSALRLLIKKIE